MRPANIAPLEERLKLIDLCLAKKVWSGSLLSEVGNHEARQWFSPRDIAALWREFLRHSEGGGVESVRETLRRRALYLYVHVPFCFKKCDFCTYHVHEWQGRDAAEVYTESTVAALRYWGGVFRGHKFRGLYVGGGTPSSLSVTQLSRILSTVRSEFEFRTLRNFSIEMNPASTTTEKIDALAMQGIRRISFGVQSFDRNVLRDENRPWHSPERVRALLEDCRARSIATSIDLLYGLSSDTDESFLRSFSEVLSFLPDQLSLYTFKAPTLERFNFASATEVARKRSHIDPSLRVAARNAGYRIQNTSDSMVLVRWDLAAQRRLFGYEYPQQVHYDDDSVLGVGDGAESRIFGRVAYKEISLGRSFEETQSIYSGTRLSKLDEMRRFVLYSLQSSRSVLYAEFLLRYGERFVDVFGEQARQTVDMGVGRMGPWSFRFASRDARERARAARLFSTDAFLQRWAERAVLGGGLHSGRPPTRAWRGPQASAEAPKFHGRSSRLQINLLGGTVIVVGEHETRSRERIRGLGFSTQGKSQDAHPAAEEAYEGLMAHLRKNTAIVTLEDLFSYLSSDERVAPLLQAVFLWRDGDGDEGR